MRLLTIVLTAVLCTLVYSGCQSAENLTESSFGPMITQITPSSGPVDTEVEVLGTGFGPMIGGLRFHDKTKKSVNAPILDWSDTRIRALVPTLPSGIQTATVDVQSSAFAESPFKVEFTIVKKP